MGLVGDVSTVVGAQRDLELPSLRDCFHIDLLLVLKVLLPGRIGEFVRVQLGNVSYLLFSSTILGLPSGVEG